MRKSKIVIQISTICMAFLVLLTAFLPLVSASGSSIDEQVTLENNDIEETSVSVNGLYHLVIM